MQRILSHCSLIPFFVRQTYAVILLELRLFETVKDYFREILQLVVVLFAAEFFLFDVACISLLWCSCLEALLCTTIVIIVKHVFKRNPSWITQPFNYFPLLFFIMYPQYLLIRRASPLVQPHWWALLLFIMENICLATTFTQWETSARKDRFIIYSSSFTLDDFRTWPREPLDECLNTTLMMPSLSLMMTSMIKKILYNALSNIFIIAEASIIFELLSKFFGISCYSDSSPLFYAASHFQQVLEYITIPTINLLISPTMKACPIEGSYLLPDDLFFQPISYVMVSLTLFLFFTCLI